MNKKIILILMIIAICLFTIYLAIFRKDGQSLKTKEFTDNVNIVATMNDEIKDDSMWCGTFQLVWNDLINELVKQEIKFDEQLDIVDNLNKQDFNENCISEKYYYKKFGLKTLDLKKEIEEGIKQKFNETSDILDNIYWNEDSLNNDETNRERYLFYAMLRKNFLYNKPFTKLENDSFSGKYNNIKYFGVDSSTNSNVKYQVEVLYYNSVDDCAVILHTKDGDNIILTKGNNENTFNEIYDRTMKKAENYDGSKWMEDIDRLKVPEIEISAKKQYKELENKDFQLKDGRFARIASALQTIQLKMDETGGSIKSEAAMDVLTKSVNLSPPQPRYFNFDDEFSMFLIEVGKEKPYYAAHISDITKFQ